MSGKNTLWRLGAAISLLAPAACVFAWRDQVWPLALFVLWTAAAGGAWLAAERRAERAKTERMLARAQRSAIETLSHHRHDWMNELQILYGYLRLQKLDKAVAIVDRIRERMDQDSRISRLGSAELASYVLSFRTMCDTLRLDVSVEDGVQLDKEDPLAEAFAQSVIGLINAFRFRAVASYGEQNVLALRISGGAEALRVEAAYQGELAAEDSLAQDVTKVLDGRGRWEAERDTAGVEGPGTARRFALTFDAGRK
ncbi:Spo0B domain-containing protein [Cohnella nanjingensis]|uniref:Spo0B domain-containing protein n=1 Tax=Cohnella nanjingensis TaxID=1387779 RepID=A0A7X0RV37_9BACL|nr:Spo0B domain-containing protein [Cohnella nanjingensis]MBB6674252.1 Spo0B domain-containing protein [Cohnella nanjingensis]